MDLARLRSRRPFVFGDDHWFMNKTGESDTCEVYKIHNHASGKFFLVTFRKPRPGAKPVPKPGSSGAKPGANPGANPGDKPGPAPEPQPGPSTSKQ